ncbi:UNVERIFIED_CONTAM: hypothetical protein HDU68_004602, partial [Siphonaria sp. JEL0065]
MQQETTGISAALSAVAKAENRLNAFLDGASFPLSADAKEDRAFLFQILNDARAYHLQLVAAEKTVQAPTWLNDVLAMTNVPEPNQILKNNQNQLFENHELKISRKRKACVVCRKLNQNTVCGACDNRVFCKRCFDAVHACVDNGGLEVLNAGRGLDVAPLDVGGPINQGFINKDNDDKVVNHVNSEKKWNARNNDLEVDGAPDEPNLREVELAHEINNELHRQQPELEDLDDDDDEGTVSIGDYNEADEVGTVDADDESEIVSSVDDQHEPNDMMPADDYRKDLILEMEGGEQEDEDMDKVSVDAESLGPDSLLNSLDPFNPSKEPVRNESIPLLGHLENIESIKQQPVLFATQEQQEKRQMEAEDPSNAIYSNDNNHEKNNGNDNNDNYNQYFRNDNCYKENPFLDVDDVHAELQRRSHSAAYAVTFSAFDDTNASLPPHFQTLEPQLSHAPSSFDSSLPIDYTTRSSTSSASIQDPLAPYLNPKTYDANDSVTHQKMHLILDSINPQLDNNGSLTPIHHSNNDFIENDSTDMDTDAVFPLSSSSSVNQLVVAACADDDEDEEPLISMKRRTISSTPVSTVENPSMEPISPGTNSAAKASSPHSHNNVDGPHASSSSISTTTRKRKIHHLKSLGFHNHERNHDPQSPMNRQNADSESEALIHDATQRVLEEANRVLGWKSRVVSVDRDAGAEVELVGRAQEPMVEVVIHQERMASPGKKGQRRSGLGGGAKKTGLEQNASVVSLVEEPPKKRGTKERIAENQCASASNTSLAVVGASEPMPSSRRTRGNSKQTEKKVIVQPQKDVLIAPTFSASTMKPDTTLSTTAEPTPTTNQPSINVIKSGPLQAPLERQQPPQTFTTNRQIDHTLKYTTTVSASPCIHCNEPTHHQCPQCNVHLCGIPKSHQGGVSKLLRKTCWLEYHKVSLRDAETVGGDHTCYKPLESSKAGR